jgi:predicted DNA binding CopG/RHH family protein
MREHYDFAKMKRLRNPYAARLKRPITIRLDSFTIAYFKSLAEEIGMPYQSLINLYLRDCAENGKRPSFQWGPKPESGS